MARRGFTLVEMLVALAITLLMMGAVVQLFELISNNVSGSRSLIEISERLRAARNRLQSDLQGATATMTPPMRPEMNGGYLEIIEGPLNERQVFASISADSQPTKAFAAQSLLGDTDDVLMFTTRSRGEPFIGRFGNMTVESQDAEVIYFCAHAPDIVTPTGPIPAEPVLAFDTAGNPIRAMTLYRRVLLVNPRLPSAAVIQAKPDYFDLYDISMHAIPPATPGGPSEAVPNVLSDLTKRENRFAHIGVFPFAASTTNPTYNNGSIAPFKGERLSDDVLLTNVLSFDVQVYDPGAPVYVLPPDPRTGVQPPPITPTDPGYQSASGVAGASTMFGAYVDLGYNPSYNPAPSRPRPLFHKLQAGRSQLTIPTYDTWSVHYESNGLDEDTDSMIDEGTDGLDSQPANGVIDDPAEQETQPPYAGALRGLRIVIRVYEPGSKQVRQVTVVQDFMPD